jgi:hypothetical protein
MRWSFKFSLKEWNVSLNSAPMKPSSGYRQLPRKFRRSMISNHHSRKSLNPRKGSILKKILSLKWSWFGNARVVTFCFLRAWRVGSSFQTISTWFFWYLSRRILFIYVCAIKIMYCLYFIFLEHQVNPIWSFHGLVRKFLWILLFKKIALCLEVADTQFDWRLFNTQLGCYSYTLLLYVRSYNQ